MVIFKRRKIRRFHKAIKLTSSGRKAAKYTYWLSRSSWAYPFNLQHKILNKTDYGLTNEAVPRFPIIGCEAKK